MMDDEVAALVVDNGSGTVKLIGFTDIHQFYSHFENFFILSWLIL